MSTFIHIDTLHRDREIFPNPADFAVTPDKLIGWTKSARTVSRLGADPKTRPLEFVTTMKINDFTIPYDIDGEGTVLAIDFPRLYLDIHSKTYDDKFLVNTIDGSIRNTRFVLQFDNIQNDNLGDPQWANFKCDMLQTLRIKRNDDLIFELFTRSGNVLPISDPLEGDDIPSRQILATFQLTPYFRDDAFDNHMVEPINIT